MTYKIYLIWWVYITIDILTHNRPDLRVSEQGEFIGAFVIVFVGAFLIKRSFNIRFYQGLIIYTAPIILYLLDKIYDKLEY